MRKLVVCLAILTAGASHGEDSKVVVLGGTGPTPHLQTVLDGVADLLRDSGIKATLSASDAKSRTVVLEEMKASGQKTLLYLSVHQAPKQRGKVVAQLFVDGKQLWQEEVRGGFLAVSAEGEVRKMLQAINDKLKNHISNSGLKGARE